MTEGVRVDLHVHSAHSPDSRLSLATLVGQLPYTGLQGFALTDHNTVAGHREIAGCRADFPRLLILPGVEVSTREGHLLVYGVSEAPTPHRPLAETLDWVRARDGVSVLAHPFRWAHGVGRRVAEAARVVGIETRNGHSSEIVNCRAELIAAHRGLASTGGSDVHELSELGRAFTEFPADVASPDDLVAALRRGQVRAEGRSLTWPGRLRLGVRTGALLVSRGLRPI